MHFSYTIAEAAELYGVHRQTVRHWLGNGLKPNDAGKPVLIHGSELNRFHAARRTAGKQPCGPDELYCLACKAPRRPAGSIADFSRGGDTGGTVTGICPECENIMSQRVNASRLAILRTQLDVAFRPAPEPIGES
jgi:excisionase family DNA binding protein